MPQKERDKEQLLGSDKQPSRDMAEIWNKNKDPEEIEKRRIKKIREKREENKKTDLGL